MSHKTICYNDKDGEFYRPISCDDVICLYQAHSTIKLKNIFSIF